MSREQKNISKLVGRIGNRYYVCDYVFKDDDFQGAVATVLMPISLEQYEDAQDMDNLKERFCDLWAEAAKDGRTEDSLEQFCQSILDCDGDESLWDFSGYKYWDEIRKQVPELNEKDYPVFECISIARSFRADMKWDELYDPELWKVIKQYESEA
jgi:hypothetical protein